MINQKIILGSGSPRRKHLLEEMGFQLEIITLDIDESFPSDMPAEQVALYIAQQKMKALSAIKSNDQFMLTADTTVICNNDLLGKPNDETHAKEILKQLSANVHKVNTGVVISYNGNIENINCFTEVTFRSLTDQQIDFYIKKCKPFDKAGSYGIQDWIGLVGIKQIKGSYTNVVGLPTDEVYETIQKLLS
jgi:septum formation protein